jgi:hypothetical protein
VKTEQRTSIPFLFPEAGSPVYSQTQPPEQGYEVVANKCETPSLVWESILNRGPIDAEVDKLSIVSGSTYMSEPLIPLISSKKACDKADGKRGVTNSLANEKSDSFLPLGNMSPGFVRYTEKFPTAYQDEETIPDTQMSEPLIPLTTETEKRTDVPSSQRSSGDLPVPLSKKRLTHPRRKDQATSINEKRNSGSRSSSPMSDLIPVSGANVPTGVGGKNAEKRYTPKKWKKLDMYAVEQVRLIFQEDHCSCSPITFYLGVLQMSSLSTAISFYKFPFKLANVLFGEKLQAL